jgi:hypothetical protein
VGGAAVMRGQLQHLVQISQRPNVTLQILPSRRMFTRTSAHPSPSCNSRNRRCPTSSTWSSYLVPPTSAVDTPSTATDA